MQQEGPSLSTRDQSQAEVEKLAIGWEKIAIDSYDPNNNPNARSSNALLALLHNLNSIFITTFATPYCQGFDLNDITPVGVPVPISDMFTPVELTHFEKALQKSNYEGTTIKAVILRNPHNPLGRSYPPQVTVEYFRFCEKHNLHLISSEIYALSDFPSSDVSNTQPFVSALSFDLKEHGINASRVRVL
ncbi:hypothetical protein AX17_004759 [Amanita inopinata Kibby_2008]|nr:hypothetical protein AX17_004759 [Amanita inopinata Kibby_2008]